MKNCVRLVLALTVLLLAGGCSMTWRAEWPVAGRNQPTAASKALLDQAESEFATAGDAGGVRRAITAYQQVLAENPADYRALTRLSTLHILLGTAYTKGRSEQSEIFHRAMKYAERAMYTNPDFRAAVSDGTPPWEAAGSLTVREVEAIFFWVTAVQYDFKDGMSLPGKIVNIGWLQHCQKMLDCIEAVAPEFGGGGVEFARVICYYALPESMGGSKARGDEYMQQAVARGDREGWLLPRWARGKYYYEILDQTELQRQDLEWVASQDPARMRDPYPWRIHFQENARELL
ncbi:hypothetical protein JCM30471_29070 [Desulfuromonas carbonis]